MLLPTHALVGMAIGKFIPNPWIVALLSLVMHYAIDSLRHGEYWEKDKTAKNLWWKIDFFSVILVLILVFWLKDFDSETIKNMLLGAFFSLLPDLLSALNYFAPNIKFLAKLKRLHVWAHNYKRLSQNSSERSWTLRNSLNDILISFISLIIIFF